MKKKRILIIYSRDMDINDSGGARTTIQLANYVSEKEGYECYCLFKIINGNNGKIIEIPDLPLSKKNLRDTVVKYDIDIVLVPEAYKYAKLAKEASEGTNCKIISALHSKPGYEKIRIFTMLKESLVYNESLVKRLRVLILIIFYPFTFFFYTRNISKRFKDVYNYSNKVVLLSKRFFEEFKQAYGVSGIDKFRAIGNALSFEHFASEYEINQKDKTILVVARLDERSKRLSLVLSSWAIIHKDYPDWDLKIVGAGRSMEYYLKMSKKLSLPRISFLGQKQPEVYYRNASIFLMTSAFEGWGMTITEAQQYGCVPIVMNSFSAIYDIIESGKNGIISPDNNIELFVENIKKIMDNKELRHDMALKGVQDSKRFTKEVILEKWIDLFEEIN